MARSLLQTYSALAQAGTPETIGEMMGCLNPHMSLAQSKLIDFALSHVKSERGVAVVEACLFHGTQIQRNDCTLYFGRRWEYDLVRRAYELGLVDARQAFSR